jgi:hypothetical protein
MNPWVVLLLRHALKPALIVCGLLVAIGAGAIIGNRALRAVMGPPLPGPQAVASKLRDVQELATAQVVVRTVQRGAARSDGIIVSNTDEILCRLLVTGDYGFDLAAIGPDRVSIRHGRIAVRLPPPALLAPGFTVAPAEILDARTTRWLTDTGPGQLAAVQAARTNALDEARSRIAELGIDREVRDTTRAALKRLLPRLLGQPGLGVTVDFDDEPEPPLPAGRG